ncbi:hypothetical protein MJ863_14665 [Alcaligenes ammonioxydans]|jgi:hypothetical protein|uniref:hypothetical protein n=1 Tax=Alcaligenes TaxID=507 RepID=UPI0007506881|nr:hypothetical protein [Alcaligenes ammonioxydans]MCH1880826.1 hypothetical protein [Alcaligenes ammonioxydans]WGQ34585.1 hypothetical protein QEZ63_11915 [Alcaligenes faecalis]
MADFFLSSHRQSGLAGSHILGALLAMILLSWLVLDVLTLYSLRVRLQHGLLQAARQASVHHARPDTIAVAFSQTLAAAKVPLHDQWQIQILSPSTQAFILHGRPSRLHEGRTSITQGWQAQQAEQSSHSGPNIYQANTLHLYLLYAHKPGPLSLLRLLPKLALSMPNPVGSTAVWLRLEIKHPMQSDAVQWNDLADGRVIYAQQLENTRVLPVSQTSGLAEREPAKTPSPDVNARLPSWDGAAPGPDTGSLSPEPAAPTPDSGGAPASPPPPACY